MKLSHASKRVARFSLAIVLGAATGLIGTATPAAAVSAAPPPSVTSTVTFMFTGEPEVWTVPASRVHRVTVNAFGAQGGRDVFEPGLGGQATATFAVTPGQQLQVNVGGVGGDAVWGGRTGSEGGWNGGGPGGRVDFYCADGDNENPCSWPGGGGGGASDVRARPYDLGDRVITAGGGGGSSYGGANCSNPDGSNAQSIGAGGGGLIGGIAPCGGNGGTQSSGGAPGGSLGGGPTGFGGTFGNGGAGGSGYPAIGSQPQGGGGGGGGWYGGGGGGVGAEISRTAGGGGGSGNGPAGVVFGSGVRLTNGIVTITYTVDNTPPMLNMPADITAVATDASGAPVQYSFSASDVDGTVVSSGCTPASSSTFPIGQTTVNCVATDDSGNTASGSFVVNVQARTTSLFNSSANPSVFGQRVFLAADVCKSSEAGPMPTGSVRFSEAATMLGVAAVDAASSPLCARAASDAITGLGLGQHTLSADYGGDASNAPSSQLLTQTVNQAGTTLTITSSVNPSTYGDSVNYTATASPQAPSTAPPAVPTGLVAFTVGGYSMDLVALAPGTHSFTAQASVSLSVLNAQTQSVTADYYGDANFTSSSAPAYSQVVNKAPTAVVVASSANPSVFGQPVTFTGTVTPTPDGGTDQFSIDASLFGSAVAVNTATGQATSAATPSLAVGTHAVQTTYAGSGNFLGSTSSSLTQTVTKASTTLMVLCGPDPVAFGQPLTCTATASPVAPGGLPASPPSGTVAVIVDGGTLSGVPSLSAVSATGTSASQFVLTGLPPGGHTISVGYGGDRNYLASTPASTGEQVTCSRTLAGDQSSLTVPAGQQLCLDHATVKGSVTVQNGGALAVVDSTISGPVSSDGAQAIRLCSTRVGASLTVSASTGFVLIGDGGDAPIDPCPGNSVRGGVKLTSNLGGLRIGRTSLSGTLTVSDNAAGSGANVAPAIEANTIGGSLACRGNAVTPTNHGHPNTVRGTGSGQCVDL